MKKKRLPIVLVSAFVSVAIAAAVSYFGSAVLWSQDNVVEHEIPRQLEGSARIVSTSAYLVSRADENCNARAE